MDKEKMKSLVARFAEVGKKMKRFVANFEEYAAESGETLIIDGEIAVNLPVLVRDAEGAETPAPDGEYALVDDGRTIVVVGGVITEVREAEDVEMGNTDAIAQALEQMSEAVEKVVAQSAAAVAECAAIKAENSARLTKIDEALKVLGRTTSTPTKTKPAEFQQPTERTLSLGDQIKVRDYERRFSKNQ